MIGGVDSWGVGRRNGTNPQPYKKYNPSTTKKLPIVAKTRMVQTDNGNNKIGDLSAKSIKNINLLF
jgi:hypothetical protein